MYKGHYFKISLITIEQSGKRWVGGRGRELILILKNVLGEGNGGLKSLVQKYGTNFF
jgi:hypothetical protein